MLERRDETAPANQSRFCEERGPPRELVTERVRAGQRARWRVIRRSIWAEIFSFGEWLIWWGSNNGEDSSTWGGGKRDTAIGYGL